MNFASKATQQSHDFPFLSVFLLFLFAPFLFKCAGKCLPLWMLLLFHALLQHSLFLKYKSYPAFTSSCLRNWQTVGFFFSRSEWSRRDDGCLDVWRVSSRSIVPRIYWTSYLLTVTPQQAAEVKVGKKNAVGTQGWRRLPLQLKVKQKADDKWICLSASSHRGQFSFVGEVKD